MPHRPIVILVALLVALGLPAVYFILKKRAEASLRGLLAERFVERPSPLQEITVPSGGRVLFHSAYIDNLGSGLVLMLGNRVWNLVKGGAYQRAAGLFKPMGSDSWAMGFRNQPGVIVATTVEGGALVVWKDLPSRASVLAHFHTASNRSDSLNSTSSPPGAARPSEVEAAARREISRAVNPRDAYFLGYLPFVVGKTIMSYPLVDMVAAHASGDAGLEHACKFSRQAIKVAEVDMHESYRQLVNLARQFAITAPLMHTADDYEPWTQQLLAGGRAATTSESAAFEAGAAAGRVQFVVSMARTMIYLRSSVPTSSFLIGETEKIARELDSAIARLVTSLGPLGGRATVESNAVRALLRKTPAISSMNSVENMQAYFEWEKPLEEHLAALGEALNQPAQT